MQDRAARRRRPPPARPVRRRSFPASAPGAGPPGRPARHRER